MSGGVLVLSLALVVGCFAELAAPPAAPAVNAAFVAPKAKPATAASAKAVDVKVEPAQTVTISVALSPTEKAAVPAAQGAPAASTAQTTAATEAVASQEKQDSSLGNDDNAPVNSGSGILPTSSSMSLGLSQRLLHLLAGLSFAMIVKALCMAGNIMVQVSPYPQVKRWESRGCTGEADAAPYVSIAFGGWQWCFYGTFAWLLTSRSGFLILVHSNCLGAVLGTYYIIAFYKNCRHQASINSLNRYLSAVMSLALLQFCAILSLPLERALFLTGLVSSFCSFVGALSMLVTVPVVIRTRDSRSIPGPLVCANLCSALVWVLCGFMLSDPLVTGPNIISAISSSICLYLKYHYPGEQCMEQEEDAEKVISSVGMGKMGASEATPLVKGMADKSTTFGPPHETLPAMIQSDGTGGTF